MTIYLPDGRWLDHAFVPRARSRVESRIVLRTVEQERLWLTAMQDAAGLDPTPKDRRTGRGPRTIPLTLRFEVLRRDDSRCTYCGRKPRQVMLDIDNLRTACSECNLGKGARVLAFGSADVKLPARQ
jgi:hypothetical protein